MRNITKDGTLAVIGLLSGIIWFMTSDSVFWASIMSFFVLFINFILQNIRFKTLKINSLKINYYFKSKKGLNNLVSLLLIWILFNIFHYNFLYPKEILNILSIGNNIHTFCFVLSYSVVIYNSIIFYIENKKK